MDAEKLLKGFSVEETHELAAALPEDVLLDEVVRRGIEVPAAVGATASQGAGLEVETSVAVPEVDAETTERLEGLPADYREQVVTRYEQKRQAVARQIKDGTLPENYQLPELSTFVERVVALAPTHEVMPKKDWQPEVVFVPKGLSLEQWDVLLTGHELGNDSKSAGAYRTWTGHEVVDQASEADGNLWGVAVISATDRPVLTNVSKDGKNGSNAKQAVKALSELPSVTDTSSAEAVVKQASPTEERYFALQLARMERGEKPVDAETWTLGKEDIKVGGALRSLYFGFNPDSRQVGSYWRGRDGSSVGGGVRPSVGDEDLVLNS